MSLVDRSFEEVCAIMDRTGETVELLVEHAADFRMCDLLDDSGPPGSGSGGGGSGGGGGSASGSNSRKSTEEPPSPGLAPGKYEEKRYKFKFYENPNSSTCLFNCLEI